MDMLASIRAVSGAKKNCFLWRTCRCQIRTAPPTVFVFSCYGGLVRLKYAPRHQKFSGLPKKDEVFFWEKEQPAFKACRLQLCNRPQTAQCCDVVEVRGLAPLYRRTARCPSTRVACESDFPRSKSASRLLDGVMRFEANRRRASSSIL